MAQRESGTVKWFNNGKGFGFIERDQGGEIFVHFSGMRDLGTTALVEGQKVEFEVIEGRRGPQAQDVVVL